MTFSAGAPSSPSTTISANTDGETKQVVELVEDLAEKFLDSYKPTDERSAVANYGHYFLGSIIISNKDGQNFIIDGQQRITSLTLLLTHLFRQLADDDQKAILSGLIYSTVYGKRSFNLEVPEREECMEAIFEGREIGEEGKSESVANILARFRDIEDVFPEDLTGKALPYFSDWLIQNVYLVEITAYSDADAYTIFETMNDRGMSLTSTEMLKSYLLANIDDSERRSKANNVWRDRVASLQSLGKETHANAITAWLRSQYAKTIRERRRHAQPRDFDLIGTEFHRWVRDHADDLSLTSQSEFGRFIEDDFDFYGHWYERIRQYADNLTDGMEPIYFNARNNFTLQYPILLAPLKRKDSEKEIHCKLRIVASSSIC